eukprot:NODE_1226_length_1709_cov_0.432919.p3 type:complete len:127 gc:universal NODE_1226_length_1709_cov_0.432919:756-1136(+)
MYLNVNVLSLIMLTRLSGISTDCPIIMNFLKALNLHLTDPSLFESIPEDCCYFFNNNGLSNIDIECSGSLSNEYITVLLLDHVSINGTIKSQFIPSKLYSLQISYTPLNTTIPSDLPNTIQSFVFV